jgi:branched-subunit amino acid transport protein
MSTTVVLIAGCAIVTAVIKGIGPLALGGRDLPSWFTSVVVLLAPCLLAALVVTQVFADGQRLAVGAETVGVAAGAVVYWKRSSVIACVLVAAGLTAALRALA